MTTTESSGLHFVVSTTVDKPDPTLRRLIRSHVMQGKNRGRTLPPRKRKRRDVVDDSASDEDISSLTPVGLEGPPEYFDPLWTVNRRFSSVLSTVRLADTVEPAKLDVLLQFSTIAKRVLFALEPCIHFSRHGEELIAPLTHDPALLHSRIFSAYYYFNAIRPGRALPPSPQTLRHILTTVRILRARLACADDETRLSNTTLAVVTGLAGHAHFTGEEKAARHHMEGLRRIVGLRGGTGVFRENAKLLVEIYRCDIGMSLHTGAPPIFFADTTSPNDSFPPSPDLTPFLPPSPSSSPSSPPSPFTTAPPLPPTLTHALTLLSTFSSAINHALATHTRLPPSAFLDALAATAYPLLHTPPFPATSAPELLRLALLAFAAATFLPWRRLGTGYAALALALRHALAGLEPGVLSPRVKLWVVLVGAVAVWEPNGKDGGWLRPMLAEAAKDCGVESWEEVREVVAGVLWIGLVFDGPAREVWEGMVEGEGEVGEVGM